MARNAPQCLDLCAAAVPESRLNRRAAMDETDDFIVESEVPERTSSIEQTGWETIVFELADDEESA
jgi:hypothetical protein